jgi:putative membrane protein
MNTPKNLHLITYAFCMALLVGTSCSEGAKKEETPGTTEHAEEMNENLEGDTEKDADRMSRVQTANLFEIQSSQEAAKRATTAEVKKLAAMMVAAHTKMGAEMQALATSKGITLPADITDEQKRDMDRLSEKTGIDYDKEYTDIMKNKHEDVIKELEKINNKSEDAEVKQFAGKGLPEVRSHLDMIETTREQIKDMKSDARKSDNERNNKKDKDDHDGHDHH